MSTCLKHYDSIVLVEFQICPCSLDTVDACANDSKVKALQTFIRSFGEHVPTSVFSFWIGRHLRKSSGVYELSVVCRLL